MPRKTQRIGEVTLARYVEQVAQDVQTGHLLDAARVIFSLPKNLAVLVAVLVADQARGTSYYEQFVEVLDAYSAGRHCGA